MKKLLAYLGTVAIVGSGIPSVVAVSSYHKNINVKSIKNNIQNFGIVTAGEARFRENRWFDHSELKPTGYFLRAGFSYKITVNTNNIPVAFVIGQWGTYADLGINDEYSQFTKYGITGEITLITPHKSGMLYIADNNQTSLKILNITSNNPWGIIKVPTFKINETNENEFIRLVQTTDSPFVEFISKHYFATMQTKMIRNQVLPMLNRSFNDTLLHWDNVWHWSNEIYGLNESYSGLNKKYPQYIHIANADKSGGYANASYGRIMFHNSSNAGKDLFLNPLNDQWGLWHETGHTYQTEQYKWTDLTEVTVNISTLFIQEKSNYQLRIFKEEEKQQWIKAYLSRPINEKDFNNIPGDEGLWTKLGMFWQLHMAFGKNFYPLLSQKYREINQDPNSFIRFNTNDKQQQEFIKITSEVTGYNLAPFFKQWGLWPTYEIENIISRYKVLTKPIWNNIADINTEHNPIVQEEIKESDNNINDITAKDVHLNFAEDYQNPSFIAKLFNIPKTIDINDLKIYLDFEPIKINGEYFINVKLILNEKNGRKSFKIFKFKMSPNGLNNTIMFKNYASNYLGMFGLDLKNNYLRFYGNNNKFLNMSTNDLVYNIKIGTDYGYLIKDIDIHYWDSFNSLIEKYQLTDGIKYFNNYTITITEKIPVAAWYLYDKNDYRQIYGIKKFVIWNNNLVELF